MKRLLSLTLAAALLAALTVAPAAVESQDARLAKVTQLVKTALALNTDGYETFHGGCSEELAPLWDLTWQREGASLSIGALEDGTVTSLSRWENDVRPGDSRWAFPTFPESGGDEAQALAEDFLRRVLRPGETVKLETPYNGAELGASDRSWSGTILLNGLPSPLQYFLSVENGQVSHFSRDVPEPIAVNSLVGGVPSPEAPADRAKAAGDLNQTLRLRLEYVLEKPEDTRAVLRYTPEPSHDFCVDAKTGTLLDLTELLEQLIGDPASPGGGQINGAAPTAKEMAADEAGSLTRAEQEGIQEMEGVLSAQELDKALRSESAYGLADYALASAAYESYPDEEGGEARVLCALRYSREGGDLTRTVSVDAKTGAVDSVWSSAPYDREKTVTEEEALEKAEAFLRRFCPDKDLVLYQTDGEITPWRMDSQPYWHFTFAQEVHGLPFRGNAVHLGIDAADGSVYSLSSQWEEDIAFESPEGVVSPETALSAWAGTYETVLAYRSVPQALNQADPVQAKMLEQGVDFAYALRLTYALERDGVYQGVDARTGRPVPGETNAREPLIYDDLDGSSAKADIEVLAQYGVGYATEKFRPGKPVTQWELVALLYSLQGAAQNPESGDRDGAYFYAYRQGALRQSERDDEAVLTRAQVVKMLLDAAGYGPAARLGGIYACGYRDAADIPAGGLGYAAIAQALGLAGETYAGGRSASRGEAASMLCRLLERPA